MELNKVLSLAEIYIRNLNLNKETTFTFISGSIIEGFGNVNSDIDLFVITTELPNIKSDESKPELLLNVNEQVIYNEVLEGIRYDIEYHKENKLMDLINDLNSLDYQGEIINPYFNESDYDFLHRFKNAIPVSNHELFYFFYNKANFDNLRIFNTAQNLNDYAGILEDIQGAYNSEDFGSVYIMSKLLVRSAINAYLSLFDETNPKEKWLFRKLQRYTEKTSDNSLLDRFLFFESLPFESTKDKNKILLKNLLSFTQNLNIKTQSMLLEKKGAYEHVN